MLAKRIILALTLATIVAVSGSVAQAQSSGAEQSATQPAPQGGGFLDVLGQIKQAQSQCLEGSCEVTVTPVIPPGAPPVPSFRAYLTNSRGGALIGSDRTHPFGST